MEEVVYCRQVFLGGTRMKMFTRQKFFIIAIIMAVIIGFLFDRGLSIIGVNYFLKVAIILMSGVFILSLGIILDALYKIFLF